MACLAFINLIFMDPCIVDDSVETPTRSSFVIEFIIPKFIEGSTCFERAHRSSSGALNSIFSPWFIYPCGDWPLPRLSGKWLIVKPDGCVRFVLFPFGVLISVYIYGLFGFYKFDIHGSVHRR